MEPRAAVAPAPPVSVPTIPAASPAPAATPAGMKLPVLVFGIVEVRRLKRELESLEEFVRQTGIREPGKQIALPRLSRLLDALATENSLNLLQPEGRTRLMAYLKDLEQHAPIIHLSFAVDPSSAFTSKIVTWLRGNIAPNALLDVGLQPTVAAGVVVRTTNKIFDMSLRERFADARGLLIEALEGVAPQPIAAPVAPASPQPSAPGVAA